MKIKGHILSVADQGDKLLVKAQGFGVRDAEWRSWFPIEFSVAEHDENRRAYYVGRKFEIEVTLK